MMRRFPSVFLMTCLLLGALAAAALHAQVKSTPVGPPLTVVKEVQALGIKEIEAHPRQVKLKGVVLYVNTKRDDFKLHDGERSIGVALPENAARPQVGDTVEIEGFTNVLHVQDHIYPHVVAEAMQVTGQNSRLPVATPASMTSVVEFRNYDQWVSTEGVVLMWTYKAPKLSLMVMGPDTWGILHVQGVRSADLPANLHGAHVRVTGINMGVSHSASDAMIAPTLEHLEILKPGKQDIFDADPVSMEDVTERRVPMLERVKVKGVVTAKADNLVIYLRDGKTAMRALQLHGWLRSYGAGQIYGDAGLMSDLKPGDEVEVVGSLTDTWRTSHSLMWCHTRVIGHQAMPLPVETTLPQIAKNACTNDLVAVKARLLHMDQVSTTKGQWRTSMIVEADGVKMPVTYQGKVQNAFHHLNVDDELLLTGLVDKATPYDPRQLWLPSADQVKSLGLANSVWERRLWIWGASAAAAILILSVWIISLRGSIKRREQADATVRELNASLEQRVVERTQALEQMQGDLRRSLDHERELGELKSRFVTMVSHEFRTPLGIIMSAVELMRYYEERLPAEQRRELYEDIYGATRLMAGLMEQVLVLGRVEAGKLGCRVLPLDLDVLAGKVTDELLSATNRRCPIHWHPEGSLEGALADEALLRHIFSNLITNAVKYSPPGRSVDFKARREGTDAVFEVVDHGIGIPPEDQKRLFEAFYRCSNVGEIPGTGLGLVIVKRCVELHNGTLQLDSEPGRGTTFTVRLPLFGGPHIGAAAAA